MAAYAALLSLMNNIEQIMNHSCLSTSFHNNQIQSLHGKAGSLLRFMDANNHVAGSKEAQDLEREIAAAAHAAEDVIESHVVDQIHAGTSEPSLSCSLDLLDKTEDMDAVLKKANEFEGKQRSGEEQPTPVMVEIGETAMVGFDAELEHFLDKLTFEKPSNLHTISIIGMGGMGKTTLAKNIYKNQLIKEHFQFRAWATISQQHNAKEILSQLLYGLGKSTDDLGLQLHKNLFGRRYLIILDDIWSVRAWDDVRCFFPDNNNGSRIVLTTRLSNVAKDCSSSPFVMKFLDEDNSKKLFWVKALKNEVCPLELDELGEEIVKLCKGLALSLVVMGGLLLKSPKTVGYWNGVLNDMKSTSYSREKQESLDVLCLSYNHLPPHLKPCFLYMGVFKEDAQIRVSRVVKLWIAEGFIKPNGSRDLEEIGESYIEEMIERNLLLVGGLRKNGKIGCCGIHDLVRDLCIKIGEQQEFFHVTEEDYNIQGSWRRLIFRDWNQIISQIPLVRSIMLPYTSQRLVKQKLLRVLEYQGYKDSSAEIYGSVNMRYLSHDQPYTELEPTVWKLPNSVSLLWNLQTLIIKKFSSLVVVAPIEIWEMRQLRHVDCWHIHIPRCNDEMMNLENLQTLKTAVNLSVCDEVCKSIPSLKKLYLVYKRKKHGYDDGLIEDVCNNLHRLDKLESLKLTFKSRRWPYPDTDLNKKLSFARSLKKLCLRNCLLEWEDLRVMGSLPQLQVLMLEAYSVHGREWSPVDGQFQHLKFLKIQNDSLQHWDADHFHFPVLEKLILCYMRKLEEIPEGIGDIPTLQLIRVENCSTSAAVSAVKIQQAQLDNGSDSLQIQVSCLWEREAEEFKEMVDSEGLSISSIQLEY